MEEQIGYALTIMMVGMVTVVCILGLVVFSGKMLVKILNSTGFKLNSSDDDSNDNNNEEDLSKQLITLAVNKWSNGKASPLSIKRIK